MNVLISLHGALPVLMICAAVLVTKMIMVGHITGYRRIQYTHYLNPEDARTFSRQEQVEGQEHPAVERALRAHRNDLESTLPFLAIAWLFLLTGPSVVLANTLFIVFTAMRCVFSLCYFLGLQPWRSLSFLAAELCVFAMLGSMIVWGFRWLS